MAFALNTLLDYKATPPSFDLLNSCPILMTHSETAFSGAGFSGVLHQRHRFCHQHASLLEGEPFSAGPATPSATSSGCTRRPP
jgi:hypothetical protein